MRRPKAEDPDAEKPGSTYVPVKSEQLTAAVVESTGDEYFLLTDGGSFHVAALTDTDPLGLEKGYFQDYYQTEDGGLPESGVLNVRSAGGSGGLREQIKMFMKGGTKDALGSAENLEKYMKQGKIIFDL
jgi:hypothetical protein